MSTVHAQCNGALKAGHHCENGSSGRQEGVTGAGGAKEQRPTLLQTTAWFPFQTYAVKQWKIPIEDETPQVDKRGHEGVRSGCARQQAWPLVSVLGVGHSPLFTLYISILLLINLYALTPPCSTDNTSRILNKVDHMGLIV